MNDNVTTIAHVLQKEFPDRAVQHQFANNLHTFRLDGETAAHWRYVIWRKQQEGNFFQDRLASETPSSVNT
jgi:hypothetical protein